MHCSIEVKVCAFCKKSFKSNITLEKHVANVHENEKKYEFCNICETMFVDLRNHIRKIHTRGTEKCILCGKGVSDLKAHQARIHGEINKKYECDICEHKSANKHALKMHSEAMHSNGENVKSINCPYCEKGYRHKKGLVDHIQKYHEKWTD